jgi:arsenate reductase
VVSASEEGGVTITIYHNPDCGTSRNVLEMIPNSGQAPRIIEYLTPPSRNELIELLWRMDMQPHELLRQKGTPYDQLGLGDAKWSEDQLIDVMLEHPILINRPIVVTDLGGKLCRRSETVLALLPQSQEKPFVKEDGTPVT